MPGAVFAAAYGNEAVVAGAFLFSVFRDLAEGGCPFLPVDGLSGVEVAAGATETVGVDDESGARLWQDAA